MHILAVAPYLPYEGIPHAGGEYLLRHLHELSVRGNRVELIVPGIPEQLLHIPDAPAWLELVTGPHVIEGRTKTRKLRDAAYRRAMNSPPAPSAESLRSVLRAGLIDRARKADIVELHWAEYARFSSILRRAGVNTPISVVEHDVDLEVAAQRVRDYAIGYRRMLGLLTAPLARTRERHGLINADVILVFKAADEATLRQAGVSTAVHVIDPWLDEPPSESPSRIPQSVLFTGALWRRENEDGLVWFLQRVWPQVRSRVVGAQLTLVGAAPSVRLRDVAASAGGVEINADVPDLLPYYQTAALFVAPLFVRGGLKFKVPQAMLCGLPVVATTVAAEGVAEHAPEDALWGVTDDPANMAAYVASALDQPERAAEVGVAATVWCRDFYSFSRSISHLLGVYSRLSAAGG